MEIDPMAQAIADHVATFIRTRFRIADDDDLFTYEIHLFEEGYVDSAGVVELIAHIEQTYGIKLPDDVLFSPLFTTVRGIAQLVARERASATTTTETGIKPAIVALNTAAAGAASVADRAATPLFCICGLYIYKPLAEGLGGATPVYGVYLPFEAEAEQRAQRERTAPELPSVEETAAEYVRAIRAQRPKGPYRVAGTSYGGIVAFEIAQQLTRAGETVELVALIDSALPGSLKLAPGRWVAGHLREFIRNGRAYGRQKVARAVAKIGAVSPSQPPASGAADAAENPVREAMYTRVIEAYEQTMRPYPGRVVLYRADHSKEFVGYEQEPDLGWARVVRDLAMVEVPGSHTSVMHKPAIDRVSGDILARTATA
jgi:thioesterase domain-containing protein/acyl carrier protein